ncbi:hypothetical protein GE09DRAFT_1232319 [Coniochaeta sp. 2T2.1]|nr:hypothetical protein GE09DRAFT_1232319 [Coniochaeta sp. 2T2.1]
MKFLTNPLALLSLLAATSSVVEACYGSGIDWTSLQGGDVDGAIRHFCSNYATKTYSPRETVYHCYPFPENNSGDRLEISVHNNDSGGARGVIENECLWNLRHIKDSCTKGGDGPFGYFQYNFDPNSGRC